jgi:hypothetical protein
MALVTENTVFLHIPKTGGVFLKFALQLGGIKHWEVGQQHEHFPLLFKYHDREFYKDKLVYTFVRHPIKWYQSRWAFRVKHGWRLGHPLDYSCASNDFNTFLQNVLNFKPDGWCQFLFYEYCKNDPELVDFVGRTENLLDDFFKVMKMANEEVDEDRIRSIPRANDSSMDEKSSGYWAKYTPEMYDKILTVENSVIQEYYPGYELDRDKFVLELPY